MSPQVIPAHPIWVKDEGVGDDPLHVELRHTIHLCFMEEFNPVDDDAVRESRFHEGDLRGRRAFRKIPEKDFAAAPNKYTAITHEYACGDSANRLCAILNPTGDDLSNISADPNAIHLNDSRRLELAHQDMEKRNGYLLVRILSKVPAAGHAFIFLSKRHVAGEPVEGYLYQSNYSEHEGDFDLADWIDDPKSKNVVKLRAYLAELVKGFHDTPEKTYEENFLASGKKLTADEAGKLKPLAGQDVSQDLLLVWRKVVEHSARLRLAAIRKQAIGEPALQ